ncbi:hypothetical protein [Chitinophaga sp. LS1]|uniref:hypothetical protein n=1 Tax=Chitinophaga sp. LS1 TaxID=3051176 RepID=UPI002AAA875E|nr:hypothetical protein [Chitinophaga sp. LS1]WPV64091.1 hypothetical protein QQL36_20015 [Chitinophaga sp. LS1]
MKRKKRIPISIPGQRARTGQPTWKKDEVGVLLLIIGIIAGHIWFGVQYKRGQEAQWVTMHINRVSITTGKYPDCRVALSYQGESFTTDTREDDYERLKDLDQVEVLYLPGTDFVELEKAAPGRRWKGFTWLSGGILVIIFLGYKDNFLKLYRLLTGK